MSVNIGNLKELKGDCSGRLPLNSIFGERIVGHEISAFNALFAYPSDTRKLIGTVANGGAITQENAMLKISTGTNPNGSAEASSRRALKYQAGHEGYAKFTAIYTLDRPNSRQYIGLIDSLNGFAVGMEGDKFCIFRKRDGLLVEIVEQDRFNLDRLDGTGKTQMKIDPSKGNVFRVSFGFLGFANISFEILSTYGQWSAFHRINYPNNHTETHITLPYLKLSAKVENFGGTEDVILRSGSVEAGIIDGSGTKVSSRDFTKRGTYNTLATINNKVVVFHNKATYGGIENRIETVLSIVSGSCEGNKPVTIFRYKLAAIPTGGTWQSISSNSIMETSENSIIDLTNAELTLVFNLAKSGQIFEKLEELDFRMLPNDYICYVVVSTGASEVSLSQAWKELF